MAFNPPLGSTSPAVLLDNAGRLDKLVNGPAADVPDREGEPLDSWRQAIARLKAAGGAMGFASAAELLAFTPSEPNTLAMDTATGTLYLWNGTAWAKAVYQNSQIVDYINGLIGSTPLAVLSDLTGSNYIVKADGSRVPSTNWRNSTYITVTEGQQLKLTAANNSASYANVAFYDQDKTFISAENVGVGPEAYTRTFAVPADGFIILATRIATSQTFACEVIKDVLTVDNSDKAGGYTSFETFETAINTLVGEAVTASGAEAFPNNGFVSVSAPTSYPTVSATSFNTGFIKVTVGSIISARLALPSSGYAIAFFSSHSAASFVEGVIGNGGESIKEYSYSVPTDGYIVLSLSTAILSTAARDSSYSISAGLIKRREVDSALDVAVPSTQNLVENKVTDVYYADINARATATIIPNQYISMAGALVSSLYQKLYVVELEAGESVFARVNLNSNALTAKYGLPVLSKYISEGVFEPISFAFKAGAVYTEHLYTATEACTIYVTAYMTDGSLPAFIRKRKYAVGSRVKQYTYPADSWEVGVVRSNGNSGRVDSNVNYMSTALIPVKAGDYVKARTVQNSTNAGATLFMGARYNKVGKYLGSTLQFTYVNNSYYGYACALIEEDGFIAVNNYSATGLYDPEVVIFSTTEDDSFFIKGPASNPYGDIYPGLAYDSAGTLVYVPTAVTYLFDRAAVPKDAEVTLSYAAGNTYMYMARLDSNRGVLSVETLTTGINTSTLLDLFTSDDVAYVGISHVSDGRRDSTAFNVLVNGRGGERAFLELSEPVYKLYDLAGRPDKTLAYDYTPLLQKLCLKMERQKRGKVYMESGLYKISGCYIKSFNHIYGDGMYNTIICGADVPFKNEKLSDHVYEKITFENLGFNLDILSSRAGRGINMEYVKDFVARNIWIYKSAITGFGVDMIMSGVLDHIVTEGCGQNKQDGSCAGMGIGVGAFLAGREPIQVMNCINRNNYGHGMFFEWHNHRESSGETIIGDFPVGVNVTNCYSEGNAVGFGNAGCNGLSYANCTAFRNLNGFAADNGSQVGEVRYGINAVFSDCKAMENGTRYIQNPYFTPRQMGFGNGNGFAVYKTADYVNPEIGDKARGYYLDNCISEDNEGHGLRVVAATNVTTPIREVSVNGGSFSRNGGSGIQLGNAAENVIIRGAMLLNNGQNGIGISAQLTDAILKDSIIKGNAKGMSAGSAEYMASTITRDNIVKGNELDLENVTNS
ncbi:right-handed parallel beta-helix repeat-containing protein [Klebsiella grimontii]|nr:right-handed parallel beta-helix repeat-containing protein [Klebsiella grimontii]MBZ7361761.1 hypothetical protein [Klebsiella grimontii]